MWCKRSGAQLARIFVKPSVWPWAERESDVPIAAVFHLPSRTFREPRLGFLDGIRKRVDVRRERRGRRRVYAGDVVIRACLRKRVGEKKGRSLMGWGEGVLLAPHSLRAGPRVRCS